MTKPLSSTQRRDIATVALALRHGMLELRNPEVLRERVSATQSTGAVYANRGLARRFNLPWGKANVNATTKSVYKTRCLTSFIYLLVSDVLPLLT